MYYWRSTIKHEANLTKLIALRTYRTAVVRSLNRSLFYTWYLVFIIHVAKRVSLLSMSSSRDINELPNIYVRHITIKKWLNRTDVETGVFLPFGVSDFVYVRRLLSLLQQSPSVASSKDILQPPRSWSVGLMWWDLCG